MSGAARAGAGDDHAHEVMPLHDALQLPAMVALRHALEARQVSWAPESDPRRRAGVAVVLRATTRGVLELLLIKRAAYEGDPWSGHIALPGGRREPDDGSLERTAMRETWEETGIDLSRQGAMLGALAEVAPLSPAIPPLIIAPFVAAVGPAEPLRLSEEVADAFWVPLPVLQDPLASRDVKLTVRGASFQVSSFQHCGHTIWGLTERILRELLALM